MTCTKFHQESDSMEPPRVRYRSVASRSLFHVACFFPARRFTSALLIIAMCSSLCLSVTRRYL